MPSFLPSLLRIILVCALVAAIPSRSWGQDGLAGPSGDPAPTVEAMFADEIGDTSPVITDEDQRLTIRSLLLKGGWMMLPIALASVLLLTIAIERALSLRRAKVMPAALMEGLARTSGARGAFDPRRAYKLLQEYPSATANVLRAMLLKIGRPHAEVEKAVQEASQREADRMYANVRWLNLIAAVTPLFGLLGTVWGMIQTFHRTTHLSPLENKANFLASGIYVALVTTLGGLAVAIPAAILAHHFEGKIQALFHQIDELLFQLLPQIERFEGRMRVDHETLSGPGTGNSVAATAGSVAAQPAAPPLPPASTPTSRS